MSRNNKSIEFETNYRRWTKSSTKKLPSGDQYSKSKNNRSSSNNRIEPKNTTLATEKEDCSSSLTSWRTHLHKKSARFSPTYLCGLDDTFSSTKSSFIQKESHRTSHDKVFSPIHRRFEIRNSSRGSIPETKFYNKIDFNRIMMNENRRPRQKMAEYVRYQKRQTLPKVPLEFMASCSEDGTSSLLSTVDLNSYHSEPRSSSQVINHNNDLLCRNRSMVTSHLATSSATTKRHLKNFKSKLPSEAGIKDKELVKSVYSRNNQIKAEYRNSINEDNVLNTVEKVQFPDRSLFESRKSDLSTLSLSYFPPKSSSPNHRQIRRANFSHRQQIIKHSQPPTPQQLSPSITVIRAPPSHLHQHQKEQSIKKIREATMYSFNLSSIQRETDYVEKLPMLQNDTIKSELPSKDNKRSNKRMSNGSCMYPWKNSETPDRPSLESLKTSKVIVSKVSNEINGCKICHHKDSLRVEGLQDSHEDNTEEQYAYGNDSDVNNCSHSYNYFNPSSSFDIVSAITDDPHFVSQACDKPPKESSRNHYCGTNVTTNTLWYRLTQEIPENSILVDISKSIDFMFRNYFVIDEKDVDAITDRIYQAKHQIDDYATAFYSNVIVQEQRFHKHKNPNPAPSITRANIGERLPKQQKT